MSGSDRKRSSKWDLKDAHEFAPDSKQLRSYKEGSDKFKPGMGKEPFSGGRGLNKDDIMDKDYRGLDATTEWDTDGIMSPGFEEWKHKRHSQSPKNGWGRSVRGSRSRSPPHGARRDSGVNDRNRMRAGGSTKTCRDFAAGNCRRGSHCHFLHHDNHNYEDSWENKCGEDGAPKYSASHESRDHSVRSGKSNDVCINFAKGWCRNGSSCRYVHHNISDGHSKGSMDEFSRERENDRRRRDSSFEQGTGHGPNRIGDTPCKFFASGNCRNGKYCRFSHDMQACRSPNRRLRDDRWGNNPGGDHQTLDRSKLSDSVSPNGRQRSDRWGSKGSMADADKVWDSPKQNDIVAVAQLVEDKGGNLDASEPGFTDWSMRDGWGSSLDKSGMHGEPPFSSDKSGMHGKPPFSSDKSGMHGKSPFSSNTKEADHWVAENTGANMRVSQPISADNWPGDAAMSPDWGYRVGSSSHIEDEHRQNKHGLTQGGMYLATAEHDRMQVAPGQGFIQSAQNVNALHSSSSHAVGHSQVAPPSLPSRGGIIEGMQNQEVSTEKKYAVEPNITDAGLSQVSSINPPTQKVVSKEQLAQLTNLSASLAHILGAGQQLPQLYAALNSKDAKDTTSAKTEVPTIPVSNTFVKPDPAVGFPKKYDPMCDSIEPQDADASGVPPAFSPIKKIADVEISPLLPNTERRNCDDSNAACPEEPLVKSEPLIQLQPGQNIEANKEDSKVVAEQKQISKDNKRNKKENGPLENRDQNGGPDEGKKTKEVKGLRPFKFALVEFVKELLKPTWKEGQINKEDYKTIVKKVVDKVTGTMQADHIPQTQEKIDHYISFSKPKLTKLVQAYVEKVQKA